MKAHSAALAAGSVASFLVPFMMSAVAIAMPVIQTEFSATAVELSWIVGSYILALAAILLPVGRLSDIVGRKRTFIWGNALFVVFSLCAALTWSVHSMIVVRVLQGVGASMILSTAMAIITEIYPRHERGRAMGILVACVYLGLSVGPLLGGFMIDLIGWRSIFFLCLPPGILTWYLARRIEGEWQPARGEYFDLPGSLFYALFVLCCISGLTGLDKPQRATILLVGAALAGFLFVFRSRTAPRPLVRLSLFRNRIFTLSSLAAMINYSGTTALGFLLSLYLQVVKGFSPMQAGLILIIQPVVQSFLSPLAGSLADRVDAAKLASLGMALCGVGLWMLCAVCEGTTLWYIGGVLSIMGLGFALFASPNTMVIMGSVEPKHYSIASSLVGTMRTFGMSLSIGITTVVFGFLMEGKPVSVDTIPEFLESMDLILSICAALCGIGVLFSLGRMRRVRSA